MDIPLGIHTGAHSHSTTAKLLVGFHTYLFVRDSLRNGRAGSRTIYQHGTDVNVLFERWVAVVNTQSQHRSRKNGGSTQLLALGQSGGRTGALLSKNIDRAVKILPAFFLTTGDLWNGILRSDRFPVSSLHEIVPSRASYLYWAGELSHRAAGTQ
jgi:hypothetical protein